MPNILFLSDTHFGHSNILQHSARPYSSVEEMNESLIENWNKMISPTDTVYHLGDFSFQKYTDFLVLIKRLNGIKHLVLGNHDRIISKNRRNAEIQAAFASISNSYLEIRVPNYPLIVCNHYAQRVWNKSHYGSIHLYGHSHGSLPPHGKSVDVGVDCKEITHDYRPVSLEEIISYMSNKEIEIVDKHT